VTYDLIRACSVTSAMNHMLQVTPGLCTIICCSNTVILASVLTLGIYVQRAIHNFRDRRQAHAEKGSQVQSYCCILLTQHSQLTRRLIEIKLHAFVFSHRSQSPLCLLHNFAHLNSGIMISNPTRGMNVCFSLCCVVLCIVGGLALG
jgi:hypothetical protein